MRALNTLYVTSHRARITTRKGSLVVHDPDRGRARVPMESLEAVALLGHAEITSPAMAACVQRGIRVTAHTRSGRIRFCVSGATGGNVELRTRQLQAFQDPEASAAIARSLVAGKLQNARAMINRWAWDSHPRERSLLDDQRERIGDALRALSGATDGDRIRGIEGDGSRRYFRALAVALSRTPFPFRARTRRPPLDPPNALLSFVYSLVHAELVGAAESHGLDPQVGFLHRLRPGRASLALDIAEELRPAHADRFSVRLLRRGELTPEDFTTRPGGACHLSDDGRAKVLQRYEAYRDTDTDHPLLDRAIPRWSLPHVQTTLMARHLRGDLTDYPPYLAPN